MHVDRRYVPNMLKAGAHGYLLKDCALEELPQAIRLVMADKTYLSPGVAEVVAKDCVHRDPNPTQTAFSVLTAREREVLQLIAEGKSNNQIACAIMPPSRGVALDKRVVFGFNLRKIGSGYRDGADAGSLPHNLV